MTKICKEDLSSIEEWADDACQYDEPGVSELAQARVLLATATSKIKSETTNQLLVLGCLFLRHVVDGLLFGVDDDFRI